MEWYLKVVLDNYANFYGRARRKEYWMFALFNFIFALITGLIDGFFGISFLYLLYALGLFIPYLAVGIRRLHDIGKSGWWLFIGIIPFVGIFWILVLMCTNSQDGVNQYGPSPKE